MKFSIIIPSYNSEKYINRCIECLKKQSYDDWEALIGDDGSDDNTYSIICEYSKSDKRIKGYSLKHAGQGSVRNTLLLKALGEYVIFLDADDWLDEICLEECKKAIDRTGSEIVIFDIRTHESGGKTNCPRRFYLNDKVTDAFTSDFLMSRNPSVVNKAYKRELFFVHNIRFLTHPYEDEIVGLLLNAYAKEVCQIPFAFYHYDRTNQISTTHSEDNIFWMLKEFEEITSDFIERDLYNKYKTSLGKLMVMLMKCEYDKRKNQLEKRNEIKIIFYDLLNKFYPETLKVIQKKIIAFGSYNLRSAVNCLLMDSENIVHFQFSSLIGAVFNSNTENVFQSDNKFRAHMVNAEFEGTFIKLLKKVKQEDYICIDFLEERFDVLQTENGYITYSDAVVESAAQNHFEKYKVIRRNSSEINALWKKSCDILINIIKSVIDSKQIILIKTYLMPNYGEYNGTIPFENNMNILRTNMILKEYYDYFEKNMPGINVVDMSESQENFSDIEFRHGCKPWHANEAWFYEVSDKLYDIMR